MKFGSWLLSLSVLLGVAAVPAAENHKLGERIAVPPEAQLTPEQRDRVKALQAGLRSEVGSSLPPGTTGPRALLVLDPKLFDAWGAFSAVASGGTTFDPRLRELAILTTARALDSPYEWYAHEALARRRGITAATVEAIRNGNAPRLERDDERAVYDYTHELQTEHRVSDATYKRAWDLLGTQQLLELTVLIGHYANVAINANAHRMALPEGAQSNLPLPDDPSPRS